MSEADKFVLPEAVVPAATPGPTGPVAAHPSPQAIRPAPHRPGPAGARPDAIQAQAPLAEVGQAKPRKPSLTRRLLTGAGVLFVLYLLGTALGLVPCSYSRFRVGGRDVVVVSYYPSVTVFSTPGMTRVETGGQRVTVRGDVVDLGPGRAVPIPSWCRDVRVSVTRGHVAVTLTAP